MRHLTLVALKAYNAYVKKKKREESLSLEEDGINNNNNPDQSNNENPGNSTDNSFYTVMIPLGLYMTVFSIQAILVTIPEISPLHFLFVTLISLAVCGTCGAIATAGIVTTAGVFPPNIGINPFFSGQALGGAAVAIANFAAIAASFCAIELPPVALESPPSVTRKRLLHFHSSFSFFAFVFETFKCLVFLIFRTLKSPNVRTFEVFWFSHLWTTSSTVSSTCIRENGAGKWEPWTGDRKDYAGQREQRGGYTELKPTPRDKII